jgi:hypothetical protein
VRRAASRKASSFFRSHSGRRAIPRGCR